MVPGEKILERAKRSAPTSSASAASSRRRSTRWCTSRARWSARDSSCRCSSAEPPPAARTPPSRSRRTTAEPVVHVLDASRAVPVTTSLLSDDGSAQTSWRSIAPSTKRFASATPRRSKPSSRSQEARARRTPIEWRAEDLATPEFTGVRVLEDFPLATLREYIDWSPFFHAWGLKGIYPRILEHEGHGEQARQIFADGQTLLDRIIAEKLITARGVYGFFPANAVGDDVELYTDDARTQGLRALPLPAPAGEPRRQRALPLARRLHRAQGDRPARLTSAPSPSPAASASRSSSRPLQGRQRRLQRHHGRSPRRPPRRSLRRVPAQAGARRVGLRPHRKPHARAN